ncbi:MULTISPECIES: hypothetical protein [Cylindrospermopsis]|uniref:Uncharacterized protein n=1 Tax=Cylindrospermopsis raciborskii CS-506_A TaxID=2585140 RepID=A0A838WRK2_9CYAN|nr:MULTISPECIES: hypothetical protein [Cylindrospermopsis]MBU6346007.1 hypothetical protein [Cyanobacteria bacterium REEB494]MBA4445290.1 hypothetical protein [Cylindrospermopsis raciborskii CS-506_C]MBA4449525.1 hypothetical protein [Cylindrospermopsis raciborskii CS-506_D]MBA4456149.1 hypothetical protein [Cylindrospermopsis raciborskii CS-506_B]MBA4465492.1 hypothetical protein [Cylindrospermopsis raciborskii CS-506_A]
MNKIVGKDESRTDKNNLPGCQEERILCPHCKRTATNGIKCKGICVADSDY